jgi:hypothetical protein
VTAETAITSRPARRVPPSQRGIDAVTQIGFCEQNDRRRTALPGERQVALESTRAEITGKSRRDEGDVDVRRDDLRLRRDACGLSQKCAPPGNDEPHDRCAVAGARYANPITDGGQVLPAGRNVTRAAREDGGYFAFAGRDGEPLAMLGHHAGWLDSVSCTGTRNFNGGCERCRPTRVPA